jgi:hypothetical protein
MHNDRRCDRGGIQEGGWLAPLAGRIFREPPADRSAMQPKTKMKYDDRVICFLDFLGFRSQIKRTDNSEQSIATAEIQRIADGIEQLRSVMDADFPDERPDVEVTQFSDSVVLSFGTTNPGGVFSALLSVLHAQMALVQRGILCRGAVTHGKLVHTKSLLFGPAMNRAYDLETKAAVYPRVILDDEILVIGRRAPAPQNNSDYERGYFMDLLSCDSDGFFYVDYISKGQDELDDPESEYPEYLRSLSNLAASGVQFADRSVAMKYRWLANKLNSHIGILKASARATLQDEDLVEAYDSLPLVALD